MSNGHHQHPEKQIAGGVVTNVTVAPSRTLPGPNDKGIKNYVVEGFDADGIMHRWGFSGTDELAIFTRLNRFLAKRGATIA